MQTRSPRTRYQAVTSQHAGPAVPPSPDLPRYHSVNTSFTGRARPDQAQHSPGPSRDCGLLFTSPDSRPAHRPGSPRPLPTPPLFPFWAAAQPNSTPPPTPKQRACLCSPFPHQATGGRTEAGGLQFCSVGSPGLISMLPGTAGQKWWAGAETLPLGPKPLPAYPSSSRLFASNREGLCAVGRKAGA